MLDFTRAQPRVRARRSSTRTRDGWPEGNGNVERDRDGRRRSSTTPSTTSARCTTTRTWRVRPGRPRRPPRPRPRADALLARFEDEWWIEAEQQYADSLGPAGEQINQKHWIGVDPMEAELWIDGEFVPGVAAFENGSRALATRENSCYSGVRPGNLGLYHTGCGGGPDGRRRVRHLLARHRASMAVGEGNYGRLGDDAAAALHVGERGDAVLRARDGRTRRTSSRARCRRSSRPKLAAGGRPTATGTPPNIDRCWIVPLDVHAGLGPLRHVLVGRAPGAGHPAEPGPRLARGRAALVTASARRRERRLGGRGGRHASRTVGVHDEGRRDRRAGLRRSGSATRCRVARRCVGHARRRAAGRLHDRVTNRGLESGQPHAGATSARSRVDGARAPRPGAAARSRGRAGCANVTASGAEATQVTRGRSERAVDVGLLAVGPPPWRDARPSDARAAVDVGLPAGDETPVDRARDARPDAPTSTSASRRAGRRHPPHAADGGRVRAHARRVAPAGTTTASVCAARAIRRPLRGRRAPSRAGPARSPAPRRAYPRPNSRVAGDAGSPPPQQPAPQLGVLAPVGEVDEQPDRHPADEPQPRVERLLRHQVDAQRGADRGAEPRPRAP